MNLMLSQPRIDVDSPVKPTVVFDPPVIRPGQRATYRVVINALEASIEWPLKPPAGSLTLVPGGRGQLMSMAGANLLPSTTFNYHARPAETGVFAVPAFTVNVYGKPVQVPAAHLQVTNNPPTSVPPPQEVVLEIPATNIFVGQAVRVRVVSLALPGGMVQGLAQVQISGEGFVVDQATARGRVDTIIRQPGGGSALTYVHELTLTPIVAGRISAFAQGYAIGSRTFGGMVISSGGVMPGAAAQYTLLDSEPVEFEAQPLPREGELPGFTGAVGKFMIDPPQLATNSVRVGDPVRLMVRVRGEGNLVRLVSPPPPVVRDWQILRGPADSTHPQIIQAQGFTTFSYTLVPLNETVTTTPEIPFSYFDPTEGSYANCAIPSVPLTVAPGAMPVDVRALAQAELSTEPALKEPVLSNLASFPGLSGSLVPLHRRPWFPIVQLAPAIAFVALWGWDRRRRYYEAHPAALLRIRARRALRRQRRLVDRAAGQAEAQAFARAAVEAMRIACSPHYPAEPQALVGSDVLALLSEPERSGRLGEVTRRFFTLTDAAQFAERNGNLGDLLGLREDLNRMLDHLEAKL